MLLERTPSPPIVLPIFLSLYTAYTAILLPIVLLHCRSVFPSVRLLLQHPFVPPQHHSTQGMHTTGQ